MCCLFSTSVNIICHQMFYLKFLIKKYFGTSTYFLTLLSRILISDQNFYILMTRKTNSICIKQVTLCHWIDSENLVSKTNDCQSPKPRGHSGHNSCPFQFICHPVLTSCIWKDHLDGGQKAPENSSVDKTSNYGAEVPPRAALCRLPDTAPHPESRVRWWNLI